MDILIRADGGEGIGMGHIMRTLCLAKALAESFNVSYVCNKDEKYDAGKNKVISEGFNVYEIDNLKEEEELLNLDAKLLIVDKYNVNNEYFKRLKEKFILVYFDDNNELAYYDVDIIINQNPHGQVLKYNAKNNTKLLIGGDYTLLREDFLKSSPINIENNIKDILITVGGSDDNNLTAQIIKQLKDRNFNLHIVIGPGFKHKDNLKLTSSNNIYFYENANMCELMKKCDIAISSCGSTLYELSYLGVPTIGVVVADNQIRCGKYMNEREVIILKDINEVLEGVKAMNYEKRLKIHNNMIKLIDGKGVNRLKNIIKYTII
ncbi:UDP-2,4-diacetamido-2,4,6-trideoxy-beta-L-altropyranose hydrolase [Clostridium cavendishii DSM 21758]|uniref:UDP-2,4-diacetamido-2,4,6-trideoxy-beta-L-altropyranose hydrolase n=1 Tax=Clostridium cavendishii DSM 21758 TaxID=1121302 RepID=A0A1M6AYS6_9CLOT|nr:UDP-2,4-diacetamido-2,4,6-trideoxy-beta-L-altropyranose hydrolase [Clostridium cavendishii]SHI41591.1 UDP-2,4-diacetamido-2,4,6-trideoxy-beta-L-altropyranose hydrolase [Clostridium cavendishii DSM 21758]